MGRRPRATGTFPGERTEKGGLERGTKMPPVPPNIPSALCREGSDNRRYHSPTVLVIVTSTIPRRACVNMVVPSAWTLGMCPQGCHLLPN